MRNARAIDEREMWREVFWINERAGCCRRLLRVRLFHADAPALLVTPRR